MYKQAQRYIRRNRIKKIKKLIMFYVPIYFERTPEIYSQSQSYSKGGMEASGAHASGAIYTWTQK